jgi:hypothetical protein
LNRLIKRELFCARTESDRIIGLSPRFWTGNIVRILLELFSDVNGLRAGDGSFLTAGTQKTQRFKGMLRGLEERCDDHSQ